jgi:hypothetical protein
MKLFIEHPSQVRLPARQSQGFTLVETYISTFLMITCVIMGLFAVHLMGLREDKLLESKGGANDTARRYINQLRYDIYAAKGWQVGNWNGTSFTGITNGSYLQGNALKIYTLILVSNQVINASNYIMYYFDSNNVANFDGRLYYMNSTNGVNRTVVSNLIDPLFFTCEDYQGKTQTVAAFQSVIHATFQYAQFQYPLTKVGSNCLFNSYHLDLRATPHLPDGP